MDGGETTDDPYVWTESRGPFDLGATVALVKGCSPALALDVLGARRVTDVGSALELRDWAAQQPYQNCASAVEAGELGGWTLVVELIGFQATRRFAASSATHRNKRRRLSQRTGSSETSQRTALLGDHLGTMHPARYRTTCAFPNVRTGLGFLEVLVDDTAQQCAADRRIPAQPSQSGPGRLVVVGKERVVGEGRDLKGA
jgi:hypothetical protein